MKVYVEAKEGTPTSVMEVAARCGNASEITFAGSRGGGPRVECIIPDEAFPGFESACKSSLGDRVLACGIVS